MTVIALESVASWGIMYHCEKCKNITVLPFTKAPKTISVPCGIGLGEDKYREINEKFRFQTNELNRDDNKKNLRNLLFPLGPIFWPIDRQVDNYWEHVENCICEACVKKIYGEDALKYSGRIKKCQNILSSVRELSDNTSSRMCSAIEKHALAYCEENIPNDYDLNELSRLLNDKDATNPNRRKNIVTNYWATHEDEFLRRILAAIGQWSDNIDKKRERYEQECIKKKQEYNEAYQQCAPQYNNIFTSCHAYNMNEFNQYVLYDESVGVVAEGLAKYAPSHFVVKATHIPSPEELHFPALKSIDSLASSISSNEYMTIIRKNLEKAMYSLWEQRGQ